MEGILDLLNILMTWNKRHSTNAGSTKVDDCSFNSIERIFFIASMIIVPINIFVPTNISNAALIYSCSRKSRYVVFSGIIGCNLCRRGNIIPKSVSLICIILYMVSQLAGVFAANTSEVIRPGPEGYALYYVQIDLGYGIMIIAAL